MKGLTTKMLRGAKDLMEKAQRRDSKPCGCYQRDHVLFACDAHFETERLRIEKGIVKP